MKHPRSKKPKRISQAVFRGKKSQYSFEVFPLASEFDDAPAVFIFSRRQTDKFGGGHHFVSCVGETASLRAEVKRHKRNKCIKQNESNVVCVMFEVSPAKRAAAVEDLKLNRSFICPPDADKSKLRPAKPDVAIFVPTRLIFTDRSLSARRSAPRTKIDDGPIVVVAANDTKRDAKKSRSKNSGAKKATKKAPPKRAAKPAKKNVRSGSASKPAGVRAAARTAKPAKTKAKRPAAAKGRARVQGGVDRDGRQHRLPKQAKPVARAAKTRATRKPKSRSKAAA